MAGVFNPAIFNNQAFNVGPATPPAGGGPIFNKGVFNTGIFNTGPEDQPGPIFNKSIFNIGIFNTGDDDGGPPPVSVVSVALSVIKTGTGGIDPTDGLRRYPPFKPDRTLHLPKKKKAKELVEARLAEERQMQLDIANQIAREFAEENVALAKQQALTEMTEAQVESEIGRILRKRVRTEEDELMLLLLMAAAAVV